MLTTNRPGSSDVALIKHAANEHPQKRDDFRSSHLYVLESEPLRTLATTQNVYIDHRRVNFRFFGRYIYVNVVFLPD